MILEIEILNRKLIRQRKHLGQVNNYKVIRLAHMKGLCNSGFTQRACRGARRPTPMSQVRHFVGSDSDIGFEYQRRRC